MKSFREDHRGARTEGTHPTLTLFSTVVRETHVSPLKNDHRLPSLSHVLIILQPFLSIIHARCQEILASVFFFFPGFEVKVGVKWGDCAIFHTFFMESRERPCVFGGSVLQWNTVVFCHHIWAKEDGQKWQEN